MARLRSLAKMERDDGVGSGLEAERGVFKNPKRDCDCADDELALEAGVTSGSGA
jgi:hypothetical protein